MKKILTILATVLALTVLLSPVVGTVFAQRGQEKLSFEFDLWGFPIPNETKEAGNNVIQRDWGFNMFPGTFVLIDEDGPNEELITSDYLGYEAPMDFQQHTKTQHMNVQVREIISIYADTDKTILRGTLEIMALGENKAGSGANFVGFGTGEFEGVKIKGTSGPLITTGTPFNINRVGTVMGWP